HGDRAGWSGDRFLYPDHQPAAIGDPRGWPRPRGASTLWFWIRVASRTAAEPDGGPPPERRLSIGIVLGRGGRTVRTTEDIAVVISEYHFTVVSSCRWSYDREMCALTTLLCCV